jgi:hypothetical protein
MKSKIKGGAEVKISISEEILIHNGLEDDPIAGAKFITRLKEAYRDHAQEVFGPDADITVSIHVKQDAGCKSGQRVNVETEGPSENDSRDVDDKRQLLEKALPAIAEMVWQKFCEETCRPFCLT